MSGNRVVSQGVIRNSTESPEKCLSPGTPSEFIFSEVISGISQLQEVSVLAGAEAGFPPAEDSSAHRSCWVSAQPSGNPVQLGCREALSGWENGFVVALLYNQHFKTCLLLLRVLVCTVLPTRQPGVQTASRNVVQQWKIKLILPKSCGPAVPAHMENGLCGALCTD